MNFDPNTGQPINGTPVQTKKTNGFAIAGFICSILVGSITGIVFSAIGLSKVKETGSGKGLAIAGLVISGVRIVLILMISILFPQLIWPVIKSDITRSARCSEAYKCTDLGNGYASCLYLDDNGAAQPIQCPIGR